MLFGLGLAMETTTSQDADEPAMPRDLRAELFQDLSTQFRTALNSNDSLPTAALEALVELLDSDAPTTPENHHRSFPKRSCSNDGWR